MTDSLKSKTLHAISWSFVESIGSKGVQFVIGIMLARLLSPKDFGLIGMLTIFMVIAESLLDSGFQSALIQKPDATPTDICSIFYFNIAIGLFVAGLLCMIAPWIAAFYGQPILTPLTRALSVTIVINSFALIQNTILTKRIDFKTLTKVSLFAGGLSGIVGVTLAILGFGVWSLAIQQISRAFFWTIFMWFVNFWRPKLIFSFESLREMFGYGSRILVSGLINRTFANSYLLVIGRLFSAIDLGLFTRAKMMQELPTQTLSWTVGRVTFPVFSTIQNDPGRLKNGFKKALSLLALINFPLMIGLMVIARPLVLVLLTEKWAGSIPFLQLLCLAGLLFPVLLINSNLFFALGKSNLFLRVSVITKVLIVVNILITWRWGISAMIYGMIGISIVELYLDTYYTGILINYPIWEQLGDLLPYLSVSALMGIAVYVVGLLPFPNNLFMVLVQIFLGTVIYVCLCWFFQFTAFMEICQEGWKKKLFLRNRTAE